MRSNVVTLTHFSSGVWRRWIVRALLCLSVALAQLPLVSHVHSFDSGEGIAAHECYTCTAAEHFDFSALNATDKVAINACHSFIKQDQTKWLLVNTVSPYFGRAPPHFA